jgi:hypothetical protein
MQNKDKPAIVSSGDKQAGEALWYTHKGVYFYLGVIHGILPVRERGHLARICNGASAMEHHDGEECLG